MFVSRQIASRLLQPHTTPAASTSRRRLWTDELPVPRGSWQALHDARRRKYNATLALGVGFSIFTFVVAKTSGLIYLNYYPAQSLD